MSLPSVSRYAKQCRARLRSRQTAYRPLLLYRANSFEAAANEGAQWATSKRPAQAPQGRLPARGLDRVVVRCRPKSFPSDVHGQGEVWRAGEAGDRQALPRFAECGDGEKGAGGGSWRGKQQPFHHLGASCARPSVESWTGWRALLCFSTARPATETPLCAHSLAAPLAPEEK